MHCSLVRLKLKGTLAGRKVCWKLDRATSAGWRTACRMQACRESSSKTGWMVYKQSWPVAPRVLNTHGWWVALAGHRAGRRKQQRGASLASDMRAAMWPILQMLPRALSTTQRLWARARGRRARTASR